MVIKLGEKRGAQPILQAIESYKARLRASIERTQRGLAQFEQQYGVDIAHFLQEMTAEDLVCLSCRASPVERRCAHSRKQVGKSPASAVATSF
jgi:hypothetical protein